MSKTRWTSGCASALVLIMLAGPIGAQDAQTPANPDEVAKALAEAAKPGPAHAKLQPLAGSWTYTCKLWMDPNKPAIETTGAIERKWILGGRFLEERVAGTGFDGKPGFEGFGLLGYDNSQKKYTYTWACTMGTGASNAIGVADPSGGFTFQTSCFCPVEKKTIKGRDVIRIESENRIVIESYIIHDGEEVKVLELTSIRK